MNINLKQNEIEAALRQYIAQQGINLSGKEVKIAFTAKRNDSGLSAELSIEDIEIPVGIPEGPIPRSPAAMIAAISPVIVTAIQEEEALIENDPSVANPVATVSLFG